jgi:hypothetical protein
MKVSSPTCSVHMVVSDKWVWSAGLRALLRFMTGLYIAMNRKDAKVRGTQVIPHGVISNLVE